MGAKEPDGAAPTALAIDAEAATAGDGAPLMKPAAAKEEAPAGVPFWRLFRRAICLGTHRPACS
jgi:hypothetical protein